jgi:tetratricopeptide (TPR) repeat protein
MVPTPSSSSARRTKGGNNSSSKAAAKVARTDDKKMTAAEQEQPLASVVAQVAEMEEMEEFYFGADRDAKLQRLAEMVSTSTDQALKAFASAPPPREVQVQGFFLKGRAASLVAGQEAASEALLSKALKLDPKMLAAWNALGEVYWNLQNYRKARECFEQAVEFCGANSVSCRNLSMVLRALDAGDDAAQAKSENFVKALEKAKEAVALGTNDPRNWETLGNAYMGDFFVNARRLDELDRALIAYDKAERLYEQMGKQNPSLQLNRGIAAKYMENYELAMRSFRNASELGAANGLVEAEKVYELVQRVSGAVERKGDIKAKHLRELTSGFKHEETYRSLRELRSAENTASPLVARVVTIIDRQAEMPVIVICCDASADFFCLSLYNTEASKVADALVPLRSLIKVDNSKFREVKLTGPSGKVFSYPCVSVAHPGDVSLVGGGKLSTLAVQSVFSARAERVESKPVECTTPCWEKDEPVATNNQTATLQCKEKAADPANERWILHEDAKMRKEEAKAKAKAKAAASSASKAKNNRHRDRDRCSNAARGAGGATAAAARTDAVSRHEDELEVAKKTTTPLVEAADQSDAEDTRATESEESKEDQSAGSEGEGSKALSKVRWADLAESDSEHVDAVVKGGDCGSKK